MIPVLVAALTMATALVYLLPPMVVTVDVHASIAAIMVFIYLVGELRLSARYR